MLKKTSDMRYSQPMGREGEGGLMKHQTLNHIFSSYKINVSTQPRAKISCTATTTTKIMQSDLSPLFSEGNTFCYLFWLVVAVVSACHRSTSTRVCATLFACNNNNSSCLTDRLINRANVVGARSHGKGVNLASN